MLLGKDFECRLSFLCFRFTVIVDSTRGSLWPVAMRCIGNFVFALTASVAVPAVSTGVVLPLYIYPSAEYDDGASNWAPAFDAISAHPNLPWLAVVNPGTGPGDTLLPGNNDTNYIAGVSMLNGFANVKTLGYARTSYGTAPMEELKKNITAWANWSSYAEANIAVEGIFLDESDDFDFITEIATFAREVFPKPITVFCHFGTATAEVYYDVCDVVGAFESYGSYLSSTTMRETIPAGRASNAAIIIHGFRGKTRDGITADVDGLKQYIDLMCESALGWLYFSSGYFSSMSIGPATVGQVARQLAAIDSSSVGEQHGGNGGSDGGENGGEDDGQDGGDGEESEEGSEEEAAAAVAEEEEKEMAVEEEEREMAVEEEEKETAVEEEEKETAAEEEVKETAVEEEEKEAAEEGGEVDEDRRKPMDPKQSGKAFSSSSRQDSSRMARMARSKRRHRSWPSAG
ncbi:hypothetical protein RJ55_04089 [Drechmeria coniospora]|nr:hypothetical protein RJ55_04089 [Drechmeria coniospora]